MIRVPVHPEDASTAGQLSSLRGRAAGFLATRFLLIGSIAMLWGWPRCAQAEWSQLPPIPDANGVAGVFAGASHGSLIVAGGANFPDGMPWEGGKKVWHDTIYVLDATATQWRVAGRLPHAVAYGAAVSCDDRIVCIGGCDAASHTADAFTLELNNGDIVRKVLPPLPVPLAYACAAIVEVDGKSVVWVAGGQKGPDATEAERSLFSLELGTPGAAWVAREPLPGSGRILAMAAAARGSFWVLGGAALVADSAGAVPRHYLTGCWQYRPNGTPRWARLADLPVALAAAPSPCPVDDSGIYVLGGDDGSQARLPVERRAGGRREVLRFEIETNQWTAAGTLPLARVTTPLIARDGRFILPSGEVRPGVRSPEVWRFTISDLKR